jgi:hypothetical protein
MTRELYEQYLAHMELLAPAAFTLLISSDSFNEDEEWAATFGNNASVEHDNIQRRRLQETELERFMNNILDTKSITTNAAGNILKQTMDLLRWRRERSEDAYPTLAGMAYDLFAMPAMNAECDRAFSSAKLLISEQRYRLKSDIIKADLCLKS